MSKSKAILGIILLFAFGVVTGLALSVRMVQTRTYQLAEGTPEELAEIITRRLGHQLSLTPDQRVQVKEITTRQLRALRKEREKLLPELKAAESAAQQEIQALLKPEQQSKFTPLAP